MNDLKKLNTKPFSLIFLKTRYLSKKKMYLEKSIQIWNHAIEISLPVQILFIQIFQRQKSPELQWF